MSAVLEDLKLKFSQVVNRGIRGLTIAQREKPAKSPEQERMEAIAAWLENDNGGAQALTDEINARLRIAVDAQRINLESHPEVAYAMGMQDGYRQVLDLLNTSGQADDADNP